MRKESLIIEMKWIRGKGKREKKFGEAEMFRKSKLHSSMEQGMKF
mgnify:CR=1 FL=1